MIVNTIYDRYTVLVRTFDTLQGACDYIRQIAAKGKCKVLPSIKGWQDGQILIEWMPTVIYDGGEMVLMPKIFANLKGKEVLI